MNLWNVAGLSAAAALAALVGGCAARHQGESAAWRTQAVESRQAFADPIARAQLRESAIEELESAAVGPDPQLRANALEGLSAAPARLEPILRRGLVDPNPGVRSVAAILAGRVRASGTTTLLRTLLDDDSGHVRASAILGLRGVGADVDPTPLASMLLSDPQMRLRAQAAFVLGELGDPSAVRLLRSAAKSPMPRANQSESRLFQLQVAEAMVKLGEEQQIHTIRAALYPSRPEELEAMVLAVQILGELRDKGSISQLIFLSAYRNEAKQPYPAEVRLAIAEALAKIGRPEGVFIAREYATSPSAMIRAQAAHVFGHAGQVEHLGALNALMADSDALVRVAAATGILRLVGRVESSGLASGSP